MAESEGMVDSPIAEEEEGVMERQATICRSAPLKSQPAQLVPQIFSPLRVQVSVSVSRVALVYMPFPPASK